MGIDSSASARAVIQRDPLGTQIAAALRQDIFFGRLLPGTRLSQQELCEHFGTSRMPVRDALRELVYDGLLELDGGRHTVVAPLNKADLRDSFLIEGMLNGLAARRAMEFATEADYAVLEDLHRRMESYHENSERTNLADLNWQFHRHINKLSGSRKLMAAIRVVSLNVPRDYLLEVPQWRKRSNADHEGILAAMRAGDGERVEHMMTDHLVSSAEGLIEYLTSKGVRLT
ncbi:MULTISPECIES: GntR family transcriptional regulator [unclassified Micromonospora]|uniref:GntR family transcriptional regulator n=1 Tax=unclassified Micromonospora TaxID=2617518 RepID=UPI001B35C468|nr:MULTISPECIES: GntR family transcriptional regulator [unclassified Micromonospora]MBQ1041010.1 GntR family transcriptional regulator [Micromonospora sp. C72]MBQ1055189.1 GntR family transcriptional regulator [Micromonospora sp. C32]